MRKFSFAALSCLTFGLSATAVAGELQSTPAPERAVDNAAAPAVFYIPTEAIDLIPSEVCPISQGNGDNSGLGCTAAVTEATTLEPVANIDDIVTGLTDAVAAYNVIITTTRPESYVPYQLLIPQDSESPKSTSEACVAAATDCDGVDRKEIGFTNGGTAACTDPDPVMTALIAFGRMSGLEGKMNAMDVMNFPPDFTMPVTTFDDACDPIVTPENPDTMMPMPLACASSYHEANGMCDGMDDTQNSHQELLAIYGPADPAILMDTTAPVIGEMTNVPAEGDVLPAGSEVDFSVAITDDSGYVFPRFTVSSPALETAFQAPGGIVTKCANKSCGVEGMQPIEFALGMDSVYPDQTMPFSMNDLPELPGGDYTITIEASDLAGNVATPVTVNFMIEGGSVDGTGGSADTSGGDDNNDDNNDDDNDDDDGDTDGGSDDDDGNQTGDDGGDDEGCSCTTDGNAGNAAFLLLGVAGLAVGRRRRRE